MSIASSSSITSTRMPLLPNESDCARSSSIARTISWREGLTHAHRVRADQVALQLLDIFGSDPDVGELAEPGRHAVHGAAFGHDPLDVAPAVENALACAVGECHEFAVIGNAHHVVQRQRRPDQHGLAFGLAQKVSSLPPMKIRSTGRATQSVHDVAPVGVVADDEVGSLPGPEPAGIVQAQCRRGIGGGRP